MKLRSLFIVYGIAAPLLLALRIWQLLFMIDPDTGFYYESYHSADSWIMAVFAVTLLILLLLGRLGSGVAHRPLMKSSGLGACSVVLGLTALVYLFHYAPTGADLNAGEIIYLALCLLFAVFLFYYAFCLFSGLEVFPVVAILPVLFAAYRLALVFTKRNGIAQTSDAVFETAMLGFTMLFWLIFGKIAAGVADEKPAKWLYGIGSAASVMCIVCAVPKYFTDIFMRDTVIRSTSTPSFLDLAVAVYILVFMIVLYRNAKHTSRSLTDDDTGGVPDSEA